MKALSILALLLPLCALAAPAESRATDRRAIEKVIAALNDPASPPAEVWAPGVNGAAERAKLTGGPLSEVFGGPVSPGEIRFQGRRTAFVFATQTQIGTLSGSRSISLVIMMKRVRAGWRITEISPQQ